MEQSNQTETEPLAEEQAIALVESEEIAEMIPVPDDDRWIDETPLEVDGWRRLWRKKGRDIWRLEVGHYAAYIFNHDTHGTNWTAGCRGNIYAQAHVTGLDEARAQARAALVLLQEQDAAKGEPDAEAYVYLSDAYAALHEMGYRGLSSNIGAVMQALWYDRPHPGEGIVTGEDCIKTLWQVRENVVDVAFLRLDTGNIDDYMAFMKAAYNLNDAIEELGRDGDNAQEGDRQWNR